MSFTGHYVVGSIVWSSFLKQNGDKNLGRVTGYDDRGGHNCIRKCQENGKMYLLFLLAAATESSKSLRRRNFSCIEARHFGHGNCSMTIVLDPASHVVELSHIDIQGTYHGVEPYLLPFSS